MQMNRTPIRSRMQSTKSWARIVGSAGEVVVARARRMQLPRPERHMRDALVVLATGVMGRVLGDPTIDVGYARDRWQYQHVPRLFVARARKLPGTGRGFEFVVTLIAGFDVRSRDLGRQLFAR